VLLLGALECRNPLGERPAAGYDQDSNHDAKNSRGDVKAEPQSLKGLKIVPQMAHQSHPDRVAGY
jgi:hypothetical protein